MAPSVRQRRLGAELRDLRERSGLKGEDVARRVNAALRQKAENARVAELDQPRLSRIEGGRLGIKAVVLDALLDVYKVDDAEKRDVLQALARSGSRRGWWQTY